MQKQNNSQMIAYFNEFDDEAAHIIAAAIIPQIKPYIAQNRERFEAWLKAERDRETCSSFSDVSEEKRG